MQEDNVRFKNFFLL